MKKKKQPKRKYRSLCTLLVKPLNITPCNGRHDHYGRNVSLCGNTGTRGRCSLLIDTKRLRVSNDACVKRRSVVYLLVSPHVRNVSVQNKISQISAATSKTKGTPLSSLWHRTRRARRDAGSTLYTKAARETCAVAPPVLTRVKTEPRYPPHDEALV